MPLTRQQALDCLASNDLIGLGMEADAIRRRTHPEGVVTYALTRTLPFPDSPAQGLKFEQQVREAVAHGASSLIVETAPTPALTTAEALFTQLKQQFAELTLAAFTPASILALTRASHLELRTVLARLRDAGLDALAPTASRTLDANELAVHRAAHQLGLATTAAIEYGHPDRPAATFLDQLEAVAQLQSETGGFTACLPVSIQAATHADEPTAIECLKTLAITRMLLDTIPHIQAHPSTPGLKVLQMTLRFGVDDAGNLPLSPAAAAKTRVSGQLSEEELRRTIRDAGFHPVQRDLRFSTCFLV